MELFELKIENTRGEVFELTNDEQNYAIIGISGLTRPDTAVNTSESAADGSCYNSSRVGMRNLVIDIDLRGDIEANRQRLYRIFPMKTACIVYFRNENRNVKIVGYVEVLDGDLFVEREQMQISIICPKPYFENLNILQEELSGVTKLFEFPFSIEINAPIPFSEIRNLSICTLVNGGDVPCGCIITIEISGDVENLSIYNTATQQFFGLDYIFQADDIIIINTKSGKEKSVFMLRNGEKINLLPYMKTGSVWIQLAVGTNDFTFTASDTGKVKILFTAVELYGGV